MSANAKKSLGSKGEQLAQDYLVSQGYTIVETNWRCTLGELDIIAQRGDMLVFVEVRTRHADTTESAWESITPRKQNRLGALAQRYLTEHDIDQVNWRVDLIAIAIPRSGPPIIEHLEDGLAWQ